MPDFITTGPSARNLAAGVAAGASVTKRGEVINMPWHVQLQMEGKVWVASCGITTTPITTNIQLAIDLTLPTITIQAPAGTTIFLLESLVYYEATGAAIAELMLTHADNAPGAGTSSAMTAGPSNMKTRGPSPASLVRQVVSVTPTYTNQVEFWRSGEPADLDSAVAGTGQAGFQWHYLQNAGGGPFIGPCSVNLFAACGTSCSIFAKMMWAEFATADLGL